jgi:2-amino-4-hydroxy-6-hydroxymethyldihydropteridine diphosphokinase
MNTFYVLVGSNINKRDNVLRCHQLLQEQTTVLAHSSVYETPAVGPDGCLQQESFYNLAYKIESSLSVVQFDRVVCKAIERDLQRERTQDPFIARTIDVDIVLCNDVAAQYEHIILPALDISQYAHVLVPLAELEPDYIHPVLNKKLSDILRSFNHVLPIKKVDVL